MEDDNQLTPQSWTAIRNYLQPQQPVTLQPVEGNPFIDPMSGATVPQLQAGGQGA